MSPHPRRIALALLLTCAAAGCGTSRTNHTEGPTVPPAAVARDGLVKALQGWRDDHPPDPHLGLVDSERIARRRLLGFEVLGPVELGVGRGFTVRLRLAPRPNEDTDTETEANTDREPEEQVARFVVFGIDPLWVFRLEDYERIAHWEHQMEPEPDEPGA